MAILMPVGQTRMTNRPLEGSGPDVGGLASIHASVEVQHECRAVFRDSVRIREEYEGEAVWDGDVYVFDLTDHPTAEVAYAVLHTGPVDSPEKAVRAAIVSEYRVAHDDA